MDDLFSIPHPSRLLLLKWASLGPTITMYSVCVCVSITVELWNMNRYAVCRLILTVKHPAKEREKRKKDNPVQLPWQPLLILHPHCQMICGAALPRIPCCYFPGRERERERERKWVERAPPLSLWQETNNHSEDERGSFILKQLCCHHLRSDALIRHPSSIDCF